MRALIVDDEALARERVRTLLGTLEGIEVIGEASGGRDAIEQILAHKPDVVFLDVQMPDVDGFEVLDAVAAEWLPAVIFITAYDEYAIKAFDVHAVDYVLKPIVPERLHAAVRRASKQDVRTLLDDRPLARLVIRSAGKLSFVKPAEIDWLEADGKHVVLHAGRETHVVRQTLTGLERRLGPHGFVRIHRSAIVNVEKIKELEPWFHGEYVVVLEDGTKLTSSAAHSRALHKLIDAAE